ncbi:MAG: alpha-galactosidase, partial [Catenulisporales bacterium]|nr:alpha-galactosidase [Catenulisporales bacterium]
MPLRNHLTRFRRSWYAAVAAATSLAAIPLIAFTVSAPPAQALNNQLALTPQMGFNDWNAYGCNVSESLIK